MITVIRVRKSKVGKMFILLLTDIQQASHFIFFFALMFFASLRGKEDGLVGSDEWERGGWWTERREEGGLDWDERRMGEIERR